MMYYMEHAPYRPVLLYMFRSDTTLTMGPYGSAGMCIINYAPLEINVVIMAMPIFDCSPQCQPYVTISAASQSIA